MKQDNPVRILSADDIQRIQAITIDMALKEEAPSVILSKVFVYCDEKNLDHFLAYRVVARTMERLRQYRIAQLKQVVNTRMQSQIIDDLNTLQEIQEWYLEQFRSEDLKIRERAQMGKYVQKLIEMKLRYSNLLTPVKEDYDDSMDPVPLSLYRRDSTIEVPSTPALSAPEDEDESEGIHSAPES